MPTISKEDYLKTIYQLELVNSDVVSPTSIAKRLNVSKAAVTDMAKKLLNQKLISYQPYKGLNLSPEGRLMATQIIRRHRLWELFLIDSLKLTWDKVHDEAERLEHSTSEFLIDEIDKYLGFPKFDPHGEPIPDKEGNLPEMPPMKLLSEAVIGKKYEILKLNDERSDLVRHLSEIGIELNKEIEIVSRLEYDSSIIIKIGNKKHSLSKMISEKISITKLTKERK